MSQSPPGNGTQATPPPWSSQARGHEPAVAPASPWAKVRTSREARTTQRVRNVVEGLPDWDPLPPGEILVRRPRS